MASTPKQRSLFEQLQAIHRRRDAHGGQEASTKQVSPHLYNLDSRVGHLDEGCFFTVHGLGGTESENVWLGELEGEMESCWTDGAQREAAMDDAIWRQGRPTPDDSPAPRRGARRP